jgi:hypothetical protein
MYQKNVFLVIFLLLAAQMAKAEQDPGGATWFTSSNIVYRQVLYGQPQAGVDLKMTVVTYKYIWPSEYIYRYDYAYYRYDYAYGVTDANGNCYLSVEVPNSEYDYLSYLRVDVIDPDFVATQSLYNYANYYANLNPRFVVILDLDQNGIDDGWEVSLAQKFCPTLKLHHTSEWIAPEPVEYIGVSKQDLWFQLYNLLGQVVGDYPIQDEALFSPPISAFWQPWMSSPYPNYSTLTGNAYDYTGTPPGNAYAQYKLRFHYNYADGVNTPSGWISSYQTERNQNLFPHTTYAHLFLSGNETVVQYWFFYPYNDGYNNHEGDWEHINVRLNGQNPTTAAITQIDFYFHNKVKTLASGYQLENGTHPKVYVGGSCAGISTPLSCESGNATGGSYPWIGTWYDVGPAGYDEYVHGLGPTIPYSAFNIIILPNRDKINYTNNPGMSWLNVSIRWGNIEVSSPWDFTEPLPFIGDVGNNAPLGPAFNSGWNGVGAVGNYESY